MQEGTLEAIQFPGGNGRDVLAEILREGAEKLLVQAVEAEVAAYIERHADFRDADGHRLVVRNGHLPERKIQTGIGPVTVRQPRVNDQRMDEAGRRIRFTSEILPPYLRKTRSIEELIPWLYLSLMCSPDTQRHTRQSQSARAFAPGVARGRSIVATWFATAGHLCYSR